MAEKTTSSGISFTGLLTIVFITLKLTNYIDWSWWWVLSPIWVTLGLVLIILIFYLIVKTISDRKAFKKYKQMRENGEYPKSGFMKRIEEAQRLNEERLNKQSSCQQQPTK